ncbi:hypothetical protein [Xanthomonas phage BUDD]|nr:hypothetical protein [Xanthomonas phage BUDD]
MADFKPLKLGSNNELTRFQTGDSIGIDAGGTGSTTAAGARTALGLAIGTDIQGHSDKLDTLAALAGTGFLVQDGANGWLARTVAVASTNRLTVTNANGVAGNPTFDLATVTDSGTGSFKKISVDSYGRVVGTANVTAADINALIDTTYLKNTGGALTGYLTLHADPTDALHAVTKQYVDTVMASGGIPPFAPAKARTTANVTLSGTQTIDGVALVAGDRVLVAQQTNASQNGVYVVAAGAWSRATDADQTAEFTPARQIFVQQGTLYGFTTWGVGNTNAPTIGTDAITFVQVGGAAQYTNGNGLSLTGTQFSAVGVNGQISVTSGGIGLATSGVSAGTYTKVTVDTYGRVTVGATATPADIGAQASSTNLTALSAYNTNGFLVQSAAGTFVGRSIAVASTARLTITNGNGVSGNPTLDLATTGVAAGTYNSVTVDVYGRVTAGTSTASDQVVTSLTNGNAGAIVIGRAVYISGANTCDVANANNYGTASVIGIATSVTTASGAAVNVAVSGVVTATTAQWDVVTGQSGGLTTGAKYYLSNTTSGALTTTAPVTGILAPVGIAVSTTKLALRLERVVVL